MKSGTLEAIRQFIGETVLSAREVAAIDDETALNENGLLDSLSTMRLISFLEQRFEVRIDEDDLIEGRLSTLASIDLLIQERTAGS